MFYWADTQINPHITKNVGLNPTFAN